MSPVRTTRSASGLFSVRSYVSAQSWARSPVAANGTIGAEAADVEIGTNGEGAGTSFPSLSVVHPYGAAGLLAGAAEEFAEGEESEAASGCWTLFSVLEADRISAAFCPTRCATYMTPAVTVRPSKITITLPARSTFGSRAECLNSAGAGCAVERTVGGMDLEPAER